MRPVALCSTRHCDTHSWACCAATGGIRGMLRCFAPSVHQHTFQHARQRHLHHLRQPTPSTCNACRAGDPPWLGNIAGGSGASAPRRPAAVDRAAGPQGLHRAPLPQGASPCRPPGGPARRLVGGAHQRGGASRGALCGPPSGAAAGPPWGEAVAVPQPRYGAFPAC